MKAPKTRGKGGDKMVDEKIIELYWKRDESAITETAQKYEKYLNVIAYNILNDIEDSRESVNDTYLKAWNSMPPQKPNVLKTYLSRLTRQISIDILKRRTRQKRGGSQYKISLCELEECIPATNNPEQEIEMRLLVTIINNFIYSLPQATRDIFVCRYYFCDSVKQISSYFNIGESKVKSILYRTRLSLKNRLESEDFYL